MGISPVPSPVPEFKRLRGWSKSDQLRMRNLSGVLVIFFTCTLTGCLDREEQKTPPSVSENPQKVEVKETAEAPQIDLSNLEEGKIFQQVCANCHGEKGEGKEELKAPSIGGLPEWYVAEQTEKFRSGLRGAHPKDIFGQQMRAITLSLTPEQVKDASAYNQKLPAGKTQKRGGKASIDRGRYIFANNCMACHRYNGSGEIVFHSAPLISLNIEYLERQLKKYRNGWRGNDESDLYGKKMIDTAQLMEDQEIEDVVNYIGALAHGDDPRPAME